MWDIRVELVRYRKVDLHHGGRNALNDTVVSFVHQRCSNVSANVSGKRSRSIMGHTSVVEKSFLGVKKGARGTLSLKVQSKCTTNRYFSNDGQHERSGDASNARHR